MAFDHDSRGSVAEHFYGSVKETLDTSFPDIGFGLVAESAARFGGTWSLERGVMEYTYDVVHVGSTKKPDTRIVTILDMVDS